MYTFRWKWNTIQPAGYTRTVWVKKLNHCVLLNQSIFPNGAVQGHLLLVPGSGTLPQQTAPSLQAENALASKL